ncbi:MAG: hypothetical protein NDF56_06475 [archaeon GB-1845-036]|nr:hypothetical protein [Candidatus Culexmicrobium thermophilum]
MLRYSEAGYAPHYSRVHIEIPDLEKIKKIDEEFIGLGDEIKDLSLKVLRSAKFSTVKTEDLTTIYDVLSKIRSILDRRIKVLRGR